MAARVVCPSCSTALSVKDEHAGRAIKCPKCGTTIPPAAPAAPPAPAEPEAPAEAPRPPDAPPPARPTARPGSRAADRDEPDERDEPRPRRRRRDDDDERDRPRRRERREPREAPQGGSNTALILGIVGLVLLTCCGGVGFGVYWMYTRVKETVQEARDSLEKMNLLVDFGSYTRLKVGSTTRTDAEQWLGPGKLATAEDVRLAFPNGAEPDRIAFWSEKVAQRRAVMWRNGDDFLLLAFHPNAESEARVQVKEWRPRNGASAREGEPDDAQFLVSYPPPKKGAPPIGGKGEDPGKPITPKTKVQAEDLAREFQTDPRAAAERYAKKTFSVNGKLSDIKVVKGELSLILEGVPGEGGPHVSCTMPSFRAPLAFNFARGQRLVVEGRCTGATAGAVSFADAAITSSEKDPAEPVEAAHLATAYRTDTSGDARFKDKQVRVANARIEKMEDGVMIAVPAGSTTVKKKIRVKFDPSYSTVTLTPPLRVGGSVTIRGLCEGVTDDEIVITGAWFLH